MKTCPPSLQSNTVNIKNHLSTIENHGLGPVDPRQPNTEFWKEKAMRWMTTEGLARSRLCANCEYYVNTTQIEDCIANGPAFTFKTSSVPVTPKLADIEDHPLAWCNKFHLYLLPIWLQRLYICPQLRLISSKAQPQLPRLSAL